MCSEPASPAVSVSECAATPSLQKRGTKENPISLEIDTGTPKGVKRGREGGLLQAAAPTNAIEAIGILKDGSLAKIKLALSTLSLVRSDWARHAEVIKILAKRILDEPLKRF